MADAGSRKRKRPTNEDWERVKSTAYQLYIREDKKLKYTMGEVERFHGLQAGERKWKEKLKAWGYTKNIPTQHWQWICAKGTKRKNEEKDTVFLHRHHQVTTEMIEGFKRRKTETCTVPFDAATPSDITYHTPPLQDQTHEPSSPSQGMCHDPAVDSPTPSEISRSSLDNAYFVCPSASDTEKYPSSKTDLERLQRHNPIDAWLSQNDDPWNPLRYASHQVGTASDVIAKHHKALFEEGSRVEDILQLNLTSYQPVEECVTEEHTALLDLSGIREHIYVDSSSAREMEQNNGSSADDIYEPMLSLSLRLLEHQCKYGDTASQTLEIHFEMAKLLEEIGNYQEAEYHCRKIITDHCQTDVEILLGLILAKCQRFQESMALLIRALTSFIIQFDINSLHWNMTLAHEIELLCTELVLLGEGDHAGWSLCLCQLMTTLKETSSECALSRIHPQLFIHGFSFAYEFSLVGFTESAGWMYEDLLHNCLGVLDIVHHALVKASAHQRFGALLRKQGRWRSSADQLLLACKSLKYSEKIDRKFCSELEMDYLELAPYLEYSMTQQLTEALEYIRPYLLLPLGDASEPAGSSRVADFMNSDLPISFSGFRRSVLDQLDEFAAPPRVTVPPEKILEPIVLTSSASLSGSGNLVTWSNSDWEYAGIPRLSDGVSTTS